MSIEFRCPNCEKKLRTGDDKAGKSAKCPQCGSAVSVPGKSPVEEDFDQFSAFDDIEDTSALPPMTGGRRRRSSAATEVACPMCGAMNDARATHCLACGEDLQSAIGDTGVRSSQEFDITDQLSKGYELFKAEMGICVAATLIYIVAPGAINFILGMVMGAASVAIVGVGGDPVVSQIVQQAVQIPNFFVQVFFDAGYAIFLLNLVRRRPATVGDIFAGGSVFLSLALNRFVFLLAVGLPAILPLGLIIAGAIAEDRGNGGEPLLIAGGIISIPLIIWGVIAKIMIWPYIWVVVDRNPAGLGALKASLHLTKGHRGQIALMGILWWLLSTAGALACCVGMFFTVPIATLMVAIGYDRLLRQKGLGL